MAKESDLGATLASSALALVVYFARGARDLSLLGDSATFVSAAAEAGVPHPSGYPSYTLIAHLASLVPLGALPTRVHLLSALLHAATVGIVAATIQRLTGSRVAAFSGALLLAFSRAFLLGSLYADAFPLNDLLSAALIHQALLLHDSKARALDSRSSISRIAGTAIVLGLGASHHQLLVLALPGAALLAYPTLRRAFRDRRVLLTFCALLLLVPLFAYGLEFACARRDPAQNWGDMQSAGDLLRLVTRSDYGGLLSPHLDQGSSAGEQIAAYAESVRSSFGLAGVGLLLLGVVMLWRTRRQVALAIASVALLSGPLFAVLNRQDLSSPFGRAYFERFTTMSLVAMAPFIGVAMAAIERRAARIVSANVARVLIGALGALPLLLSHDINLRGDHRGPGFAQDLLIGVEDGALVLTTSDLANSALGYRCGVERRCGRIVTFSPGQMHLDWRVRQLRRRHPDLLIPEPEGSFVTARELLSANLATRPLYVMPELLGKEPGLQDAFEYEPRGLLLRVSPRGSGPSLQADLAESAVSLLGCKGCLPGPFRPDLEQPLDTVYAVALVNHARLLRALGGSASLIQSLERRARKLDPKLVRQLD